MNIKRGKKRLLIGVPVLSTFVAFFGGVRLWAMYETMGHVCAAGVVFAFIILLMWFFIRTLRWIVKGFDLYDDKWMSLKGIVNKHEKSLSALQEDNAIIRQEKLRAIAKGYDPDDQEARQQNWWQKNFGDTTSIYANSSGLKEFPELKLYALVFILIILGASVIVGLAVLLLGPPPS